MIIRIDFKFWMELTNLLDPNMIIQDPERLRIVHILLSKLFRTINGVRASDLTEQSRNLLKLYKKSKIYLHNELTIEIFEYLLGRSELSENFIKAATGVFGYSKSEADFFLLL